MRPIAAFTLLLLVAGRAVADDDKAAQAKTLYAEATALYDLGRYKEALDKYVRAFLLRPDQPVFLFNAAQCYRQLGEPAEAARAYRSYLRDEPNAANRADVEKRIADMDRAVEERRAKLPPIGTEPPAALAPVVAPAVTITTTPPASEGARTPRSRLWLWLTVGAAAVVVAALAVGLGVGLTRSAGSVAPPSTFGNLAVIP